MNKLQTTRVWLSSMKSTLVIKDMLDQNMGYPETKNNRNNAPRALETEKTWRCVAYSIIKRNTPRPPFSTRHSGSSGRHNQTPLPSHRTSHLSGGNPPSPQNTAMVQPIGVASLQDHTHDTTLGTHVSTATRYRGHDKLIGASWRRQRHRCSGRRQWPRSPGAPDP